MGIPPSPSMKARLKKRSVLILLSFLAFSAVLLINILRLDILAYEKYREKTYDQITTTSKLKAARGNIYDSNMNLLASTQTTWRVFVSPKAIANYEKSTGKDLKQTIATGISRIFGADFDNVYNTISNRSVLDATLERSANEDEYAALIDFIQEFDLSDFVFTEAQHSRYYPSQTMAAHVLGFTGSDSQGLYGLEYYYNSTLSGTDGYYLYAKDANGNPMPDSYTDVVDPIDGNSIVTTIDSFIQAKLESQLAAIVDNHDVTGRATGIVMNTKSGAILAMATSSPYNPNFPFKLDALSARKLAGAGYEEDSAEYKALRSELMQAMWSNKAVSETYEPGSTFKIITVAAALDSGAADFDDRFSCHGYRTVGGWRIKCHKHEGHGSGFTLAYGLQMSCNPTMMQIAEQTGAEKFYSYVKDFGYLEKTGIDLPSEARSIFHDLDDIGPTELATASFGQRFKVSVINQLTAIAAVANGGYLVTPYVVDSIIDRSGNVISKTSPNVKRQVISEDVADEISKVLAEGVSGDGGAKNAYVDGYSVAAKTGTSQKFDVLDENGNSYLRIGSTVAYVSSGDEGIAAIIVVDEPQSQVKYGSYVAAPYISSLFSEILPYLEYERSEPPLDFTVGNYVGMNVNSAATALKNSQIPYEVIGDGSVVLSQIPSADISVIASATKIYLYTENTASDKITVPNMIGMSAADANRLAVNAGLNIKITGVKDPERDCLKVTGQSLPPGTETSRGETIELHLMRTDFED